MMNSQKPSRKIPNQETDDLCARTDDARIKLNSMKREFHLVNIRLNNLKRTLQFLLRRCKKDPANIGLFREKDEVAELFQDLKEELKNIRNSIPEQEKILTALRNEVRELDKSSEFEISSKLSMA